MLVIYKLLYPLRESQNTDYPEPQYEEDKKRCPAALIEYKKVKRCMQCGGKDNSKYCCAPARL